MTISTRTIASVAAGIVLLWAGIATAAYFLLPDWASRGQFGDVFGAVNSLFSGFAFSGLIFAILLQREDLELQRQELTLTRQELSRSAAAQEQSEAALRAQAQSAASSARLSTINFLLDHYKQELKAMRGVAYAGNDPRLPRMRELEEREARLLEELNVLYREVIKDEQPVN
jgi:hypothetical protein